jgi:hypothetical protein
MLMEILFGDGGRIQAPLYREGVVDDSLTAGYECERDYAFALVSAEVDEPSSYKRRLLRAWRDAVSAGVGAEETERCRRRFLGRHLRVFNAPEACAHWVLGLALENVEPAWVVDALRAATPALLARRLRDLAAAPRTWSILTPKSSASA